MNFLSGQEKIKCPQHYVSFCCDYIGTTKHCSVQFCNRKSKWRCPFNCNISLCSKHFTVSKNDPLILQGIVSEDVYEFSPPLSNQDTEDSEDSAISENSQCQHDFDSSYFIGPSCSDTQLLGNFVDSDAGFIYL